MQRAPHDSRPLGPCDFIQGLGRPRRSTDIERQKLRPSVYKVCTTNGLDSMALLGPLLEKNQPKRRDRSIAQPWTASMFIPPPLLLPSHRRGIHSHMSSRMPWPKSRMGPARERVPGLGGGRGLSGLCHDRKLPPPIATAQKSQNARYVLSIETDDARLSVRRVRAVLSGRVLVSWFQKSFGGKRNSSGTRSRRAVSGARRRHHGLKWLPSTVDGFVLL